MAHRKHYTGNLDISSMENIIEEALNSLTPSTNPEMSEALTFLAPKGFRAIVELCDESGRSKHRNLSGKSWSPKVDEIRIYFEPEAEESKKPIELSGESMGTYIEEFCQHLAKAQAQGHPFVALKWFRDSYLVRKSLDWVHGISNRQAVLEEAIAVGLVIAYKVDNPKLPDFPTTAIKLKEGFSGEEALIEKSEDVQSEG